jgi:hypothetical protein
MYGGELSTYEVVFAKALAVDSVPQEKLQHNAANLPRTAAR